MGTIRIAAAVLISLASAGLRAGVPDAVFANGFEAICGTYYIDADGDGFGVDGSGSFQCGPLPGYASVDGDCSDMDASTYPGAYEFFDDGTDNDCDGSADVLQSCDDGLLLSSTNPDDAALAMDVCASDADDGHGLVDASWTLPDGSAPPVTNFDIGHGIESGFGTNVAPEAGARLLVLSSGTARQPGSPGYQADFNKGYSGNFPAGYPLDNPNCPGIVTGLPHDGVALLLTVRAPPFATGLSFRFAYYTRDWPNFVCNAFADRFVVQLLPPGGLPNSGLLNYDFVANPTTEVSVRACSCVGDPPCMAGGLAFACPLGTEPLASTGFDSNGATGWLDAVQLPVVPGELVTLRFWVHDAGDGILDSTALIDALRWHSQ